jgi:23S rRNA pseudouridine2604 synthase
MRIYPIGRLDKDSEGLILLTNDGNIVNKILRAENHHEKEYIVAVNREITPEFIKRMSSGIPILNTVTNPCTVTQIDKYSFSIILTQGLNRQIRRMCEYLDYRLVALRRIRIMNIKLGRLKTGSYRNVTDKEIEELNRLILSRASLKGEVASNNFINKNND